MATEAQRYYKQWGWLGHQVIIRGKVRYRHCSDQLCCWGPRDKLDKKK
jgi:hypothetical protein